MTSRSLVQPPRIISAEEAFARLGQQSLDEFARAVLRAWDRYRTDFAPRMGKPPGRFRATAMQALMVEEIEKVFGGGVVHRGGRALLQAAPGIVVQMKKLNDRGMPSNYPTPTALAFARQLTIPGMPPGTRLTLGYILNSLKTDVAEVRLLAQVGNTVAWSRELTVNQTVIPLVVPTAGSLKHEQAMPKQRRLQAKKAVTPNKDRKPGA